MKNTNPDARLNLAGGGATLEIDATGSVTIVNSKGQGTQYQECPYLPQLSRNLIPRGRLLRAGATTVLLNDPHFKIEHNGKEIFIGKFFGDGCLMYVPIKTLVSQDATLSSESIKKDKLMFLKIHYSLGHPSEEYMKRMMRLGFPKDVVKENSNVDEMNIVSKCPVCPLAKKHYLPFKDV